MPAPATLLPYICARCLRTPRRIGALQAHAANRRSFASSAPRRQPNDNGGSNAREDSAKGAEQQRLPVQDVKDVKDVRDVKIVSDGKDGAEAEGAMARRLRELSDEALSSSPRSHQKTIAEAGFSEDLRKQLEERIASATFRAKNRSAFTEAELPSHAGRGTRQVATADPWTGEETIYDASLRMLNDAHKPLRLGRGVHIPGPAAQLPTTVDTGHKPAGGRAAGTRLANARDRSGLYTSLKDSTDLDEQERAKRFQELKDRFSPHARSVVPGTVQGLASLANERIEDAIARGQFKNLPQRGKKMERDYNASNPFLDTTEYFLNKMIQKQEIVPPWIEKQQELVSAATKFRARLRNDWKRHAARMIASKGGSVQDQMRRAEAYAKAEYIANPRQKKKESLTLVDSAGHFSEISLSGELNVATPSNSSAETTQVIAEEVVVEKFALVDDPSRPPPSSVPKSSSTQSIQFDLPSFSAGLPPSPLPFRDEQWLATEHAFHTLSIADLNTKTRSYNLQAPDLAKKPYFSLSRELDACYADVAPQLAQAIRERATAPRAKTVGFGESLGQQEVNGVMDRFIGEKVRVRDERMERRYGFRQFWKDVWGDKGASRP